MERPDVASWLVAGVPLSPTPTGTVRELVSGVLRERILSGELEPGSRIDLDAVGAEFGTSRTPVREACLELMHDGMVRVLARSGVVVAELSRDGVVENFAVMAAVSGVAAEWAANRIEPDELRRVREINQQMTVAARVGDDITLLNWMFHREVHRACKSPPLLAMLGVAGRMIPRRFLEMFPEHVECSLEEHASLVRALERRDGLTARRVTEQHLQAAAEVLSVKLSTGDASSRINQRSHVDPWRRDGDHDDASEYAARSLTHG